MTLTLTLFFFKRKRADIFQFPPHLVLKALLTRRILDISCSISLCSHKYCDETLAAAVYPLHSVSDSFEDFVQCIDSKDMVYFPSSFIIFFVNDSKSEVMHSMQGYDFFSILVALAASKH
jgi:hypothetical protein